MNLRRFRRPAIVATASVAVLSLGLGGTAAAKAYIDGSDIKNGSVSGKDIKDNSLMGKDIKNGSVHMKELADSVAKAIRAGLISEADVRALLTGKVSSGSLATKLQGYVTKKQLDDLVKDFLTGADIENFLTEAEINNKLSDYLKSADFGTAFDAAFASEFGDPNWGVNLRNTQGAASATLRQGPYTDNFDNFGAEPSQPPLGSGSLQLQSSGLSSKVDFGNEQDFTGDSLASFDDALSFETYTTKENRARGGAYHLPVIRIEVDPDTEAAGGYSSLVFVPSKDVAAGKWTKIDATDAADGRWFATSDGKVLTDTCAEAGKCTWAEMKNLFDGAGIQSVSIGTNGTGAKDFLGVVDAFRIGNTVYDFEARGVFGG